MKIRTSLVATAKMWKDLPRFGANAISCTGSVTVIRASAFAYFLYSIRKLTFNAMKIASDASYVNQR